MKIFKGKWKKIEEIYFYFFPASCSFMSSLDFKEVSICLLNDLSLLLLFPTYWHCWNLKISGCWTPFWIHEYLGRVGGWQEGYLHKNPLFTPFSFFYWFMKSCVQCPSSFHKEKIEVNFFYKILYYIVLNLFWVIHKNIKIINIIINKIINIIIKRVPGDVSVCMSIYCIMFKSG